MCLRWMLFYLLLKMLDEQNMKDNIGAPSLYNFDSIQLVKRAIEISGGLRKLGRRCEWHSGAIAEVLGGKVRLPPYRAIQCAELVGENPDLWMFAVLAFSARTENERTYWCNRIEQTEKKSGL